LDYRIDSRRQARDLDRDRLPRVLVVGRPSDDVDAAPQWEALFDELGRRGRCLPTAIPTARRLDRGALAMIASSLERGDIDVLVAQGWEQFPAIAAAATSGVPSIWSLPERWRPTHPAFASAEDAFAALAALSLPYQVVFTNPLSIALMQPDAPRGNFIVIDAVPLDDPTTRFDVAAERETIRQQWGWPDDTTVILATAPLAAEDVWRSMVDAMRRLPRSERRRAYLVIVGDGWSDDRIDERLRREARRVGAGVALITRPERIESWLAAADVFLAQPLDNPRPLSVMRAMQFSLPLVGTRELILADLLAPSGNGLSARPLDPGSMARALARMIKDPAWRGRLGTNSRHWLDSRAHPEWVIDSWGRLVREGSELNEGRDRHAGARPRGARASTEALVGLNSK
jgi:glycosyltransferase involved in cell wall biosynthesis